MTRDEIQKSSLLAIENNEFNGTIVLSTGTGKTKVGYDSINKKKPKKVLITYPRLPLLASWEKEKKWLKFSDVEIDFMSIQSAYGLSVEKLSEYNYAIIDEIHTSVTEGYGNVIISLRNLEVPVLGLTATPDLEQELKEQFYDQYVPIIYEFKDSAKEGIVNKRVNHVLLYDLDDKFGLTVTTKTGVREVGEKGHYEYLQYLIDTNRRDIELYYYNSVKRRANEIVKRGGGKNEYPYMDTLYHVLEDDLYTFKNRYWELMKAKKLPYNLYADLRFIYGKDYVKFGLKAFQAASTAPEEIRSKFYKYISAVKRRKSMLYNLASSKLYTLKLKKEILKNENNKVLIFSQRVDRAKELSEFAVKGGTNKSEKELISSYINDFDNGEIRELSSVDVLSLGLNLVGANNAIMESINSSNTKMTQKGGRLDRLPVDETAQVYWIVPKNTQAQKWFETATESWDQEFIYYDTIEELLKGVT